MFCDFVRKECFLLIAVVFFVKLVFLDGFFKTRDHVDDFADFARRMHDLHKSLGTW